MADDTISIAEPMTGRRHVAGELMPGMSVGNTGLGLARGELGRKPWRFEPPDPTPRMLSDSREVGIDGGG